MQFLLQIGHFNIFTFSGTYNYQCDPHVTMGMIGTIIVNPPSNTVYDIVSNSTDHTTLKTALHVH